MIVLVTGGRDFTDRDVLFRTMDELHRSTPITMVIEGGQRTWTAPGGEIVGGADYWASQWALSRVIALMTVEANWHDLSHSDALIKTSARGMLYDAKAGPRRNANMLELNPVKVIAFAGGRGTADMLRHARAAGIETIEVQA